MALITKERIMDAGYDGTLEDYRDDEGDVLTGEHIPPPRQYTCCDCGTKGSLRWMDQHPCDAVQGVNEFGGRCEDYPACGHVGADAGCAPQESHTKDYWSDIFAARERAGYDFDDPMFDSMD